YVRRNAVGFVLGIQREHPDLASSRAQVINDADSAAFTTTRSAPAQLPDATGPADDLAGLRVRGNRELQRGVLVVRQIAAHQAGEQLRLDEGQHFHYTSEPYYVKDVAGRSPDREAADPRAQRVRQTAAAPNRSGVGDPRPLEATRQIGKEELLEAK